MVMWRPALLIVDDDRESAGRLAALLRDHAYEVGTACSGSVGIAVAQRTRYDAVLMDLLMPGLTGVEAMRVIKASAPNLPVIIMTADAHRELVEDAERAGPLAVFPKPLEPDRLLALPARARRPTGGPPGAPG
jgi:CheY-like chemotaxis protein